MLIVNRAASIVCVVSELVCVVSELVCDFCVVCELIVTSDFCAVRVKVRMRLRMAVNDRNAAANGSE